MKTPRKEFATARVKVFPSTHKKIKIMAAKNGQSMAAFVEKNIFPQNNVVLEDNKD